MFLKFLHIFLAFNVLLSTSGITVFEHLCDMKGRTIGIFIKPNDCCHKEKKETSNKPSKSCCHKKTTQKGLAFAKKPCCEDKTQQFKSNINGTSAQAITSANIDLQVFDDTISPLPFLSTPTEAIVLSQKVLRFYLYKPPPLVRDISVLVQNFRC
jgi:hypothetical protein